MYNFQGFDFFNLWNSQNILAMTQPLLVNSTPTLEPCPSLQAQAKEKFKCELCKKSFKSKHNLISHKKNIHDQVFRVNCQKCGQNFANKYTLKKHCKKMHPPTTEIN
jgi:2-phosphoglycerate kinase